MKKALIFWLTGLSGAGKSTVASGAKAFLEKEGCPVLVLDGDEIRSRIHQRLGFTPADIKENNERIAQLCLDQREHYDIIIVSIISPFAESRERARRLLGEPFYEVYLAADLETVMKRDSKGLYAKAQRGEIENLIGYSPGVPYEAPENPDCVIDSRNESPEESVRRFQEFITEKLRQYERR